jgi:hypothetical protein
MATLDPVANFIKLTVSTGYGSSDTTIVLSVGGSLLPSPSFNMTWWNSTDYPDPSNDPNAEIVRVTVVSGNTLTITRAQEGTSASTKNTAGKTYQIMLGITAKMITDIGSEISANTSNITTLTSDVSTINTELTPALAAIAALEGAFEFAALYSGADMGAQINAAYAALPAAGGTIIVPQGNHSYSTMIAITTAEKPALLLGGVGGSTTLTWTGGANTCACWINPTKAVKPGMGIQGIKFSGPGSAGSTIGLFLGGIGADDGQGFAGGTLRDVYVQNFGFGIETGNNCFLLTLDNCVVNFNGVLLYELGGAGAGASFGTSGTNTVNAGENMRCINCTFADSNNQIGGQSAARYGINLQNSGVTDWNFIACSFDDVELYINKSGGTANDIHITNCHFENPAANSISAYCFITTLGSTSSAAVTIDIVNTTFVQDATTSAPTTFIQAGCQVNMFGVTAVNNGGSTVSTFLISLNGSSADAFRWIGFRNIATAVTNVAGTTSASSAWWNGTGAYASLSPAGLLVARSFNTVLDASTFLTGSNDIGGAVNAAYATAVAAGLKSVIITIPAGSFSFSTPIVFGTDGVRASLRGTPGDGTILTFTGGSSTKAVTVNCGYQGDGASSEHAKYEVMRDITLKGNNTSTTNPEVGVFLGGTNGAAGAIVNFCKIEGFGQGLVQGSNTYMWALENVVFRNCGQNMYLGGTDASVTNSGEGITFLNVFCVDPAGNSPTNGFFIDNSAVASLTIIGGSFDDCQVRIQQANNVTFIGTHFENPGNTAWGPYDYVVIDDNPATQVNFVGCVFFNDSTTSGNSPTTFILNGGTVTLTGVITRAFGGQTVTSFCTIQGSGIVTWHGFNNVGSSVTNVVGSIAATSDGWTNSTGAFGTVSTAGVIIGRKAYVAATGTYAIKTTDEMVDCTSGTFTATLPTAVSVSGKTYTVKNSGTGTITVATTSAQTIDGASTQPLVTQYSAITMVSDGANWKIVA